MELSTQSQAIMKQKVKFLSALQSCDDIWVANGNGQIPVTHTKNINVLNLGNHDIQINFLFK